MDRVELSHLNAQRPRSALITTPLKVYPRQSALICDRVNLWRTKYMPAYISCNKVVIYVISSLYTQWNISYKSGSVLNNHDIFQNIYTDIYIFNEILFRTIENYF